MNSLLRRFVLIVVGQQLIRLLLRGRMNLATLSRNIALLTLSFMTSVLVGWLLIEEEHLLRGRSAMPRQLPGRSVATDHGDDLTVIEGIGESYARALNSIGITSFSDLAHQDPAELSQRLEGRVSATRIRNQNWIGQARQLSGRA